MVHLACDEYQAGLNTWYIVAAPAGISRQFNVLKPLISLAMMTSAGLEAWAGKLIGQQKRALAGAGACRRLCRNRGIRTANREINGRA